MILQTLTMITNLPIAIAHIMLTVYLVQSPYMASFSISMFIAITIISAIFIKAHYRHK